MGKQRRCTPEQIINNLCEAEVLIVQGKMIGEAARQLGVTWLNAYGDSTTIQSVHTAHLAKKRHLQRIGEA